MYLRIIIKEWLLQGCGMVDVTLKDGIEKTLLETLPELAGVKDMTDHSLDENAFYKDES